MSKERISGLLFLIPGVYGVIFSFGYPMGQWNSPGPGVFPLCASILLCIVGGFWLFHRNGKRRLKTQKINWVSLIKMQATPFKIIGITAAGILTLEKGGYLLISSLYVFILFFWVCRYRLWIALVLSMAVGTGSWYFFEKLLSIQLPQGFLPL